MQSGVEKKFIILFAILIAFTGFTFEAQSNKMQSSQAPIHSAQTSIINKP